MDGSPVQLVPVQDQLPKGQGREDWQFGRRQVEFVGQQIVRQVEKFQAPEDGEKLEDLGPVRQEVVGQVQLRDVRQPARVDPVWSWN